MKPFLKKFAQVGGIVALALVLGIGVSVFADNYVGAPAFPQNAPTPLNILGDASGAQSKGDARLILPSTDPYAQMPVGKQNFAGSTLSLWGSTFVGKNLNVFGYANTGDLTVGTSGVSGNSRVANIFGKLFVNNDTTNPSAGIKVGGDSAAGTLASTLRAALDIDLTGRTGAGSVDGISIKSALGAMTSAFITNSQVFHFYSDLIAKDARIWAGSIKLSEYSPTTGKVLVSGNNSGDAVWATVDWQKLLKPDIKVVEESKMGMDDGDRLFIYCPADYAAISVSCTRDRDSFPDWCDIVNRSGQINYSIENQDVGKVVDWATMAAVGEYAGGVFSPADDDNGGSNINSHMKVFCQRYQNFPSPVTIPTPTAVSSVVPVGSNPNASWKTLTGGISGSVGQSCSSWLPTTGQAGTQGVRAQYVATNSILPDKCAYMGTGPNGCILGNASVAPQGTRPVAACLEQGVGGNEIRTQTYR